MYKKPYEDDLLNNGNFDKNFFIKAWPGGYVEPGYGIGNYSVYNLCIKPFLSADKTALEIGPGGGTFTKFMFPFKNLYLLDVVPKSSRIPDNENISYIELKNQDYYCTGVKDNCIDFAFSYGVFCHLNNEALKTYVHSINRVLKHEGDFVFMLSNFEKIKQRFLSECFAYKWGEMTPIGHFYQDDQTIDYVVNSEEYNIINRNMCKEHRDILVHIQKK